MSNEITEPGVGASGAGRFARVTKGLFWLLLCVGAVAGLITWLIASGRADAFDWMAWTRPTAIFFIVIFTLLVIMSIWEVSSPGGGPRQGILGIETTRGDRLFLSLLGSAFIHLAWLALVGPDLWKALGVSIAYAALVFLLV